MINYRKARLADVENMLQLVQIFAEKGLMLPRSRHTLYESIREFFVAVDEEKIVALGSLHILWLDLAEIRTMAVREEYQGQGLGRKLLELLLQEARELACQEVFTLTYQVDFFRKMGFLAVDKESMPQKVWQDCIHCVKFPNCDENAMVLSLTDKEA